MKSKNQYNEEDEYPDIIDDEIEIDITIEDHFRGGYRLTKEEKEKYDKE